jgi:hypothetical protein
VILTLNAIANMSAHQGIKLTKSGHGPCKKSSTPFLYASSSSRDKTIIFVAACVVVEVVVRGVVVVVVVVDVLCLGLNPPNFTTKGRSPVFRLLVFSSSNWSAIRQSICLDLK